LLLVWTSVIENGILFEIPETVPFSMCSSTITIKGGINMFKTIIVRKPAKSIINGITSNPQLGKPVYEKAVRQHEAYVQALEKCDVTVEKLEADERYPDSCFVEDVAVCTPVFALITNPGTSSRKGEQKEITDVLKKYYDDFVYITEPGTLEGGDVMRARDHYYIGLSERTNREGATQFIAALEKRGMSGSVVEMNEMLHLKTGIAYLGENILLVTGEMIHKKRFVRFEQIVVEPDEAYAANSIRVNDVVLVPEGFEKTKREIEDRGLSTITVDTSEFMKIDGGLSCLSLRF